MSFSNWLSGNLPFDTGKMPEKKETVIIKGNKIRCLPNGILIADGFDTLKKIRVLFAKIQSLPYSHRSPHLL